MLRRQSALCTEIGAPPAAEPTLADVQVLVPAEVRPIEDLRHTGTSVLVEGVLKQSPADATGQVLHPVDEAVLLQQLR